MSFFISLLARRSAEEIAESPITKHAPGFQDFTSPLKGKKKRQLPIAPRRRGRAASGEDEGEEWGRGEGEEHYITCSVKKRHCLFFPSLAVPEKETLSLFPFISGSGRLTLSKETAHFQEWVVLRVTNAHQTMFQWLLFAQNRGLSQTNRL